MSRRHRLDEPGATFHVTTRLLQSEPLFTPILRTRIVEMLRDQTAESDATLFAYAIMPSHLHLVIRQGGEPLRWFMQTFLQRVALLVQRSHGREGHVVERRFRSRLCDDPVYIRRAIIYVHLNPVRAGLCATADRFRWSSRGAWSGSPAADGGPHPVAWDLVAPLFSLRDVEDRDSLRADYATFEAWRQARDRHRANPEAPLPGPPPPSDRGDLYWHLRLSQEAWEADMERSGRLAPGGSQTAPPSRGREDLDRITAGALIALELTHLDLAILRSSLGGSAYVRARHEIIRRARAAGYRGTEIAAWLGISTSSVSRVIAAARRARLISQASTADSADPRS